MNVPLYDATVLRKVPSVDSGFCALQCNREYKSIFWNSPPGLRYA